MITNESNLTIVDNSGARSVLVIRCLGGSNRKFSSIGDRVVVTVKKADPNGNIKKGDVVFALIVTTRNRFLRSNGTYISFSKNCAIIVNKDGDPLGTRILIPLLFELEMSGGSKKLTNIAREII